MSDEWINQFGAIIVDEAHGADAKVISGIMEKAVDVKYRLGFTGTLDGTKVHKMVLTGLFGKVITVTTTRERIDAGDMSDAHITMVGLCYPDADRQKLKKFKQVKRNDKLVWKKAEYKDEIDFIIKHPVRRKFVAGFVSQLKGNTLILFNRNDDYGLPLFDMIKAIIPERSHLVYGGTDNEDREQVRTIMANGKDEIVLASMGTFSVGTNIPSIRNIVFTYPMKGRIQLLQSLGRGLRKSEGKSILKVYDLVDDFRCSGYENYAWRHMGERVKEYDLIGFERTWVDVQF
jgi:superfamily II DNA or RNA helicase